ELDHGECCQNERPERSLTRPESYASRKKVGRERETEVGQELNQPDVTVATAELHREQHRNLTVGSSTVHSTVERPAQICEAMMLLPQCRPREVVVEGVGGVLWREHGENNPIDGGRSDCRREREQHRLAEHMFDRGNPA